MIGVNSDNLPLMKPSITENLTRSLLARLEKYQADTGLPMKAICRRACGSASFVDRLRDGTVTIQVVDRVVAYLDANPPEKAAGYRQRIISGNGSDQEVVQKDSTAPLKSKPIVSAGEYPNAAR